MAVRHRLCFKVGAAAIRDIFTPVRTGFEVGPLNQVMTMPVSNERIEGSCDAPCYEIVKACEALGYHSPLDVAWYHRRRYLGPTDAIGTLAAIASYALFGRAPRSQRCRCGRPMPELARCTFTFASTRQESLDIGQCSCCGTLFWDESEKGS